jgi:phosphodiesterase/alkaline phosphatase D-like protein
LRNCRADQRGLLTFLDQNKIDNTIVLTGGK